jgi:hypothetical protein
MWTRRVKILHPASMQMCCKVGGCTTSCAGVPLGPLSRSVQPIFHSSAIVADETGAKDTVYLSTRAVRTETRRQFLFHPSKPTAHRCSSSLSRRRTMADGEGEAPPVEAEAAAAPVEEAEAAAPPAEEAAAPAEEPAEAGGSPEAGKAPSVAGSKEGGDGGSTSGGGPVRSHEN